MTSVFTDTRSNSVTYVADNILKCLTDIIRMSGMNPTHFENNMESNMLGIKTWLDSEHLEKATLEIYDPATNKLIRCWDIDVNYNWSSGDGNNWTDNEQLKWAICKAGGTPPTAEYRLIAHTKHGNPDVPGWCWTTARSTDGMVRQSLGSTIEHNGLGAAASYWRPAS